MVKEITHEILYLPGRIEAPHFFRISTLDATRLNKELDYTSLSYYLGLPLRCKLRYLHGSPALPRIPIVQVMSPSALHDIGATRRGSQRLPRHDRETETGAQHQQDGRHPKQDDHQSDVQACLKTDQHLGVHLG